MKFENFNEQFDYYKGIAEQHGLKSVWSDYKVTDFNAVPFPYATTLEYSDHWGEETISVIIEGNKTWLDLWKCAEKCINKSEDDHHIFVERFVHNGHGVVKLYTGS